ncbi:double homeobox protein B-like [Choloepus didactylus]|uniref:double homeobox protein B-like n=1 Tax=Choloepus didactylus TaxID=27675 RepID=UPI00189E2BB5|nr:double homeobox protein B-like [Choloepus didactylus]
MDLENRESTKYNYGTPGGPWRCAGHRCCRSAPNPGAQQSKPERRRSGGRHAAGVAAQAGPSSHPGSSASTSPAIAKALGSRGSGPVALPPLEPQNWRPGELETCQGRDALQREARRRRIVLNRSQKDLLEACFKWNPYPGIATREQLAKDTGISEPRIQVWFQNHRTRQLKAQRLKSRRSVGEQTQVQDQPLLKTQEYLGAGHRKNRLYLTRSQSSVLVQAFEKNQFPGIATREELAKETGIPESRIQIWFQNRRARHQKRSKGAPVNSLADAPDVRKELTVQQHQNDPSTVPSRSHDIPPSNSFIINQNSCLILYTSFVPWDPFAGHANQAPTILVVQPTQTVQGLENPHPPLTPVNQLPTVLPPEREFLDTETPLCPQDQGKCQDRSEPIEPIDLEVLESKNYLQFKLDSKKQWKDLSHQDITFFIEWWDECCQALIAEWEPPEGTL